MRTVILLSALLSLTCSVWLWAAEIHVSTAGDDKNTGTADKPLRTIQRAADMAQPGDTVTVHAGVYRERINPPRGGDSDARRITYQAAPGEKVEIKGSERITGWEKLENDTWKVVLPNAFFGDYNPFADEIRGDWFNGLGRKHHTGAVYLNGQWLTEAVSLDEVLATDGSRPAWLTQSQRDRDLNPNLWYADVDGSNTTIWAQFAGADPNQEQVEVNVRPCVFYPDKPGCNYITVRGFALRQAATPWAPPTAEQMGLIGTHWSKGWIIENNTISHSVCTGVTLGKYGDERDNKAESAEGYVVTIQRALAHPIPWEKARIGGHIVRNNHISHCEQAGIVGSMGAAYSTVTGNTIHHINVRRLFGGAEMAGIKFHGAIDTLISRNHIYRSIQGIWLDWMSQGTRVSANLFHDNVSQDLFLEVNHGPHLVDNNVFLSAVSVRDQSQGGAFVHNLFGGRLISMTEPNRETPYHPPHATAIAGLASIAGGDNRFYNNIFVGNGSPPLADKPDDPKSAGGYGPWVYNFRTRASAAGGNVYYRGARPNDTETDAVVFEKLDPALTLNKSADGLQLSHAFAPLDEHGPFRLVTTELLGKAAVPGQPFTHPDGRPLKIDTDYFGKPRNSQNPLPGPFATIEANPLLLIDSRDQAP